MKIKVWVLIDKINKKLRKAYLSDALHVTLIKPINIPDPYAKWVECSLSIKGVKRK